MYFFSLFASEKQSDKMILRCIGLFISATLPVLIIIIPKFTDIQLKKFMRENIYDGSKVENTSEHLKQSKISVGFNSNLRSQSMRVLPDASTPKLDNSSLRCHTPSKSLLGSDHQGNI